MTPRRIIRMLGLNAFPFILAALGALAGVALLRLAGLFEPGALLQLLLGRYETFQDTTLSLAEPYLTDALAAYWPATPAPGLSGLWRDVFAVGAVVALAVAVPVGRLKGVFIGILNGAVGLLVAAVVALGFDLYASDAPILPLAFIALLIPAAAYRLIAGYRRLNAERTGEAEPSAWRDSQAAIEGNWTILGAAALGGALAALDASAYSETLAAALWLGV